MIKQITIRMDGKVFQQLKKIAYIENRSLNAQVEHLLDSSIKNYECEINLKKLQNYNCDNEKMKDYIEQIVKQFSEGNNEGWKRKI